MVLEIEQGSSLVEMVGFLKVNEKYIEETDFWSLILQGLLMLKEFSNFGVINCKMDPWCLTWTEEKKLSYFPSSFSGIDSKEAVNIKGNIYTPDTDIEKREFPHSNVFNLGILGLILLKPDNRFFNAKTKKLDYDELKAAMSKEEDLVGPDDNEAFSKELNGLIRDMLIYDAADRPSVGMLNFM